MKKTKRVEINAFRFIRFACAVISISITMKKLFAIRKMSECLLEPLKTKKKKIDPRPCGLCTFPD